MILRSASGAPTSSSKRRIESAEFFSHAIRPASFATNELSASVATPRRPSCYLCSRYTVIIDKEHHREALRPRFYIAGQEFEPTFNAAPSGFCSSSAGTRQVGALSERARPSSTTLGKLT